MNRVPHGPWPDPNEYRTHPSGPPGFFGYPPGFDLRQPMFVQFGSDKAAPVHHHAYDNRQVHIDGRQVHIQPGLTPEIMLQLQHLRESDRRFAYEALSAAAQEKIQGVESEAQLNHNAIMNNMRLAEERAETRFWHHDATLREEASNTVNFAKSEINAAKQKAEAEEREKQQAAQRLHEVEVEKRNLAEQLQREQFLSIQRMREIEQENRRLAEVAQRAEAERHEVEEQRKQAERQRQEAQETAAILCQEKLISQKEVLREREHAQRIAEEANIQAAVGRTNRDANALEIEKLKRKLASAQNKIEQSEATYLINNLDMKNMARRLAELEGEMRTRATSHVPPRALAGGANQHPGPGRGGAVSPPLDVPPTVLSPIRRVPEVPTPESQRWKSQPSFGVGTAGCFNMFTQEKVTSSKSHDISPPPSMFAWSPHGTATPDPPPLPPVLPVFSGGSPDGGSRP